MTFRHGFFRLLAMKKFVHLINHAVYKWCNAIYKKYFGTIINISSLILVYIQKQYVTRLFNIFNFFI